MRKCFTILILTLVFVRCNNNEERNTPSAGAGMKKPPLVYYRAETGKKVTTAYPEKATEPVPGYQNKKKKKVTGKPVTEAGERPCKRIPDTALMRKLTRLRSAELEIDLREPGSRAYLFSPIENPEFSSMILLSHERSIRINFDNDILDNTDRYYTNGIRFDFISPFLKQFPLSWLMVPYWGKGINYYGVSIAQNMYTPFTTKIGGIHQGDRPYAAYLFVGSFKISNDPVRKFRQTTELDLGVIGPSSYGDFVQKSFHNSVPTNNEPLGWEYQVEDDLVLNYHLSYEKGIISRQNLELNLNANGSMGTLYTNMSGGFQFRAGLFYPYFSSPGNYRMPVNKVKGYSNFQLYFFLSSIGKLVGYDATLEGGLLNRSSIYKLKPAEVSRFVYQGSAGITFSYAWFRFDIEQFLLSPEFSACRWHKWVHFGVTIGI
jgi:lipid A 3-O-deacylase